MGITRTIAIDRAAIGNDRRAGTSRLMVCLINCVYTECCKNTNTLLMIWVLLSMRKVADEVVGWCTAQCRYYLPLKHLIFDIFQNFLALLFSGNSTGGLRWRSNVADSGGCVMVTSLGRPVSVLQLCCADSAESSMQ